MSLHLIALKGSGTENKPLDTVCPQGTISQKIFCVGGLFEGVY